MDTTPGAIPVVLVGGEQASGLADMLRQFIEQTLAESPRKVRQARALSGRAVFRSAEDKEVCVCITFAGDHIELRDGAEQDRAPSIAADFLTIAHLTSGQESPFWLLAQRRLKARFSVTQVPFLLRMLRFMQIESQSRHSAWIRWALLIAAAAAIAAGAYWYVTTVGSGASGEASTTTRTGTVATLRCRQSPAVREPPDGRKGDIPMSVIYSEAWYEDMKQLINGADQLGKVAPQRRIALSLEVMGDGVSPYVPKDGGLYFLLVIENGKVVEFRPLPERHDGKDLNFRFTAPATVWEGVASGKNDPIRCGLRGEIKVRGDMKFLMENADAVKLAIDLYAHQMNTEWPLGQPPYTPA